MTNKIVERRYCMVRLVRVFRITTFVPPQMLDCVLQAIVALDPLHYGNYRSVCWFSVPGTEQFIPESGSNPTSGKKDVLTREASIRLEFSVSADDPEHVNRVLEALVSSHPWEEPVVQVYEVFETRSS